MEQAGRPGRHDAGPGAETARRNYPALTRAEAVEGAARAEAFRALERRRRRLAERLAAELARAPHGRHGAGNEYVSATAMQVRLGTRTGQPLPREYAGVAVDVQVALADAPRLISIGAPVEQVDGIGGTVLVVHGLADDDWSVVFPSRPWTGLVLVCLDEPENQCLYAAGEDLATVAALEQFHADVATAINNRENLIATGLLPPDAQPLRHPS